MSYIIMYEEDDGDCRYFNWQPCKSLEESIDFMAGVKSRHGERVVGFLKSETEIKDIDIPEISEELIKYKKEEQKIRDEEASADKEKLDKIKYERLERENYERLKQKYG